MNDENKYDEFSFNEGEKPNVEPSKKEGSKPTPKEHDPFADLDDEIEERDHFTKQAGPLVSNQRKMGAGLIIVAVLGFVYFMFQFFFSEDDTIPVQVQTADELTDMKTGGRANVPVTDQTGGTIENPEMQTDPIAENAGTGGVMNVPPPPPPIPLANNSIYLPDEAEFSGGSAGMDLGGGASSGGVITSPLFGGALTKQEKAPSNGSLDDNGLDLGTGAEPSAEDPGIALDAGKQGVVSEEMKGRIQSPMFVGNTGGGVLGGNGGTGTGGANNAAEEEEFVLNASSAGSTNVTKVSDLKSMILQGKMIDAVLETAINTDLPGRLRAIISRDVYAENSRRVLIPKGSRLIGAYNTDVGFGKARIYIVWTRIIRPDGIDAMFDEGSESLIATDLLGRSGVYGDLDNRFAEIFGSSILISSIAVAFGMAGDAITGGDQVTVTQNGTGGTQESGSTVAYATRGAVDQLGAKVGDIANKYFDIRPRITVDQGTRIKIFVNRDIKFPKSDYGQDGVMVY